MKEHPNATTAEFSHAFKNLDKSTLLVSQFDVVDLTCTNNYLSITKRRAKPSG